MSDVKRHVLYVAGVREHRGGRYVLATDYAHLQRRCEEMRAQLAIAEEILGFHEGSAKRQIRDGAPYGAPVVWINGEDHAKALAAVRKALGDAP